MKATRKPEVSAGGIAVAGPEMLPSPVFDMEVMREKLRSLDPKVKPAFFDLLKTFHREHQLTLTEGLTDGRDLVMLDSLRQMHRLIYTDQAIFFRGKQRPQLENISAFLWWLQHTSLKISARLKEKDKYSELYTIEGSDGGKRSFLEDMRKVTVMCGRDLFRDFLYGHMRAHGTPCVVKLVPLSPDGGFPGPSVTPTATTLYYPEKWDEGMWMKPYADWRAVHRLYIHYPLFVRWIGVLMKNFPFFDISLPSTSLFRRLLDINPESVRSLEMFHSNPVDFFGFEDLGGGTEAVKPDNPEVSPYTQAFVGLQKIIHSFMWQGDKAVERFFGKLPELLMSLSDFNEEGRARLYPLRAEGIESGLMLIKGDLSRKTMLENYMGSQLMSLCAPDVVIPKIYPIFSDGFPQLVDSTGKQMLESLTPKPGKGAVSFSTLLESGAFEVMREMHGRQKGPTQYRLGQHLSYLHALAKRLGVLNAEMLEPGTSLGLVEGALPERKHPPEEVSTMDLYKVMAGYTFIGHLIGDRKASDFIRSEGASFMNESWLHYDDETEELKVAAMTSNASSAIISFKKSNRFVTEFREANGKDEDAELIAFRNFFEAFTVEPEKRLYKDNFVRFVAEVPEGQEDLDADTKLRVLAVAIGIMRSALRIYYNTPELDRLEKLLEFPLISYNKNFAFRRLRAFADLVESYGPDKLKGLCDFYERKEKAEGHLSPVNYTEPYRPYDPNPTKVGRIVMVAGHKVLWVEGVLDYFNQSALMKLIKENKDLQIMVLGKVPGTVALENTHELGKLVYNRQIHIVLCPSASACSGGATLVHSARRTVILALEGEDISLTKRVGVHEWFNKATGKGGQRYIDLSHLEYYKQLGMTEQEAYDFDRFQSRVAPREGMHYITEEEANRWRFGDVVYIPAEMPVDEAIIRFVIPYLPPPYCPSPPNSPPESGRKDGPG
ncbi:hypothetical protein FUAX_17000 [Fulvitalea axinellae]|uniref:Uncharacterized protein n=1 Tax=Fulvitalea axinellae TaxID=1182444 RepID=A0AAU9CGW7_9BACT|nr:hypothetical protein FUAX_17000 [Fulvitalea axinellae]